MAKRGFTLIEVLVVLGVIGLLMAILLPAVNAARENNRRAQCSGNLKSIGLALQAYESVFGMYPSAWYANHTLPSDGSPGSYKHFSVYTHLLPQLGSEQLFASVNLDLESFTYGPSDIDGANATAARVPVAAFVCPSDLPRSRPFGSIAYRASFGVGPYWFEHRDNPTAAGAFGMFEWHRAGDFTDGLETTVGFSERLLGDGDLARFDPQADFWYSAVYFTGLGLPPVEVMVSVCDALQMPNPPHYSDSGATWMLAGYENTLYNHAATPNSTIRDCSPEAFNNPPKTNGGVIGARSRHSGGVNALMMGGSVRFVSDSVSLAVWRAAATRAGGETVDF